jgi:hypothetical protein
MLTRRFPHLILVALAGVWLAAAPPPRRSAAPVAPQQAATAKPPAAVPLPNADGSLKFGVLGDFGNGNRQQYELGAVMAKVQAQFRYELVITVGDNIYGDERPQDMKRKFEDPYKGVLDAGVKFYASLGNHDERAQAKYNLFNMEGRTYYTFKAPRQDVRFFALETDYPTPEQIAWLQQELERSNEAWKIPYFHHPLYSSGKRHGSRPDLRQVLEPLFLKNGVSVVFAGHDHFYERTKPQHGITHFVVGSGGQLRRGNIDRKSPILALGFDTDLAFLVAEIQDDRLTFNTISRTGAVIDSGVIERRREPRP